MTLHSEILEQIAFTTQPKIEEHMLIVIVISTHEENVPQLLQTINKHLPPSLLVTTVSLILQTKKLFSFQAAEYNVIRVFPGVYGLERLYAEIKRIFIEEGYFTEEDYPFKINQNFSTKASIIEIEPGIE